MKFRVLALMAAAVLVVGLLAVPGLATHTNTDSGDTSNSEAEISVVDCVVESSKDISYVAFLDSGDELDKFNVNAPTYDLTGYGDIDSVDSVRVKSGETVESFGVDCGDTADTDDDTTGDDTTGDHDDTTGDDDDDTTGDDDDTTGDDDDDATEPDEVKNHNDKANSNSQATITLSGCTLNSSKDISYIAFLSDGSQADKIEDVDDTSYDLDGYDGIEDVDQVRVKAGTTVATFGVSCGDATTDGDTHDDAKDDDDTDTDNHATDDDHDDTTGEDDTTGDDDTTDGDDDVTHDEDDDDVVKDDWDDDSDDTEDDSDDDTAETDGEWDARHDGTHDHKDHEEIDHEDS